MRATMYKPVLVGAFLMAFSGISSLGQSYPPQPYQNQGSSAQQLDNLVAPVALYPDSLLSQVLVACTYPQQLAEAGQWLARTPYLQGEQRLEAAQQENWDPSVQALVAFPDLLQRLTQDPQWTSELGNAFLNDQAAVMIAVQDLRERARQSGRLQSTPQQTVNIENFGGERAIEIVPANPEVVYVPAYDPAYIWGAPAYGYYPSLSYPSWGFGFGGGVALGGFFGGYRGGYGDRNGGWGWGSNWRDHRVTVNNDFFYRNRFSGYRDGQYSAGSTIWRHDNVRGNAFSGGYTAGQRNYGRGYNNQQSFNNNDGRQGFRSNPQASPQYQPPADRYTRQFSSPAPQQYSRQQYSQPQVTQPRAVQQAPQQQFGQARSYQPQGQQQFARPQYSQPQFSQPRSFQQAPQRQFEQPRSFQPQVPQQQYSRPQNSQPRAQQSEQRSFGRNDGGSGQQRFTGQADRQSSVGGEHHHR